MLLFSGVEAGFCCLDSGFWICFDEAAVSVFVDSTSSSEDELIELISDQKINKMWKQMGNDYTPVSFGAVGMVLDSFFSLATKNPSMLWE